MSLDLLIPFIILIGLVLYLIYTRSKFEKNIQRLYDKKFEEWKKNSVSNKNKKPCKNLIGLIFKEGYTITIDVLDEKERENLQQRRFKIKDKS